MNNCPKCKTKVSNEKPTECLVCGIVFEKYEKRKKEVLNEALKRIGSDSLRGADQILLDVSRQYIDLEHELKILARQISNALLLKDSGQMSEAEKILVGVGKGYPPLELAIRSLFEESYQPEEKGKEDEFRLTRGEGVEEYDSQVPEVTSGNSEAEFKRAKLKPCPTCSKTISTEAVSCPHCGHPLQNYTLMSGIEHKENCKTKDQPTKPRNLKPDKKTDKKRTIIAILAIGIWYLLPDSGPDILYGKYGYALMGFLSAIIAHIKNRNPVVWFALGQWFALFPVIIIIFLSKLHDKLCPYCKKGIAVDASICPYCRSKVINTDL